MEWLSNEYFARNYSETSDSWKRHGAAVASKNNDTDGEGPVRVPKNQNFPARANWVTGESLFLRVEILLTYVVVINLQEVCIIVL